MQGPGRSTSRAYGSVLQQQIKEKIARASGEQDLGVAEMFSFARAELRANHVDERAELMNTMYGLCRGLTTATGLLIPIFVGAGIKTDDWGRLVIGIAIAAAFSILYFRRTARYSFRFADQVWLDFAALHLPDWR